MHIVLMQSLGISDKQLDTLKIKLSKHTISDNPSSLKDADILITVNHPLDAKLLASCPHLKMISVAFTGYDHVDIHYCKQKDITVCNTAGYATDAVAELTFGLILSLLRSIPQCDTTTRQGGTRVNLIGQELRGKTLGIIGTGNIGSRVAEIGKAFGCNVIEYSHRAQQENFLTLIKTSDIITIHTPLTSETKDLISWNEFKLMKPTAILIQTSRGGTVNEEALVDALNTKKIAGAGVDVFVQEPPVSLTNLLLKTKHSILTPHVAFATEESLIRRASIAVQNIVSWIDGKPQNKIC